MPATYDYINGPAIILNSGSISDHALANPDTYGRYSLKYTVGMNNESFLELKRICTNILTQAGVDPDSIKLPWRLNEKTKMVGIWCNTSNKPQIIDSDNRRVTARSITAGTFAKVNVKPTVYRREEVAEYLNPVTFEPVRDETTITGLTVMLNGIKLYKEEEVNDLF